MIYTQLFDWTEMPNYAKNIEIKDWIIAILSGKAKIWTFVYFLENHRMGEDL